MKFLPHDTQFLICANEACKATFSKKPESRMRCSHCGNDHVFFEIHISRYIRVASAKLDGG